MKKISEFNDFKKVCVDSADSVYKMVWEQVLLLSIYTRQQLFEQDTILVESNLNFENKLKLVQLLCEARSKEEIKDYQEPYEELRDGILQRIEEYNHIHQITDYLMDVSKTHENKVYSDLAKWFLTKISSQHISFSSREQFKWHKHPYSYYAMYKSLTESLSVFRKILDLEFSEKDISAQIFNCIRSEYKLDYTLSQPNQKDSVLYQFKTSLKQTQNLKEAFEVMALSEYSNTINFAPIFVKARSALAKKIGTDVHNIFSVFQKNIITKGEYSKTPVSFFEQMITCQYNSGDLVLKIDTKLLEKYQLLGKLDGVMDAIRRKIAPDNPPISSREEYRYPSTDRNSLLEIANWYKQVKTPLFIKITDCPSLVASILEFDFRMGIGIFDENYGVIEIPFKKKTWFSKDGYLVVTAIIRLFLYHKNPVPELYKRSYIKYDEKDSYIKNLTKYVNEDLCPSQEKDIKEDGNKIMEEWASPSFDENLSEDLPQYIAMINRFKRLPIYLKPEKKINESQKNKLKTHGNQKSYIWNTRQLIEIQIERSKKESYPIDSSFPLPLWI